MSILEMIKDLPDPRMEGKVKHNLGSIIFTTVCAILSGCESWTEVSDYCEIKNEWLSKYVVFPNGVPSEWTFRRVFTLLDPKFLETLLRTHAEETASKRSDQIALDGKAVRGSKGSDFGCLHSVSAWCHENGLVLAEEAVGEKSNEITAIPLLLEGLEIKGSTISIDAAGCQKSIAKLIIDKKGHYVLGLKGNQKKLFSAVEAYIQEQGFLEENRLSDDFDESHGRMVRRRYFSYDIRKLDEATEWPGAQSVVAVETIRGTPNNPNNKVTAGWRYYLSSHKASNEKLPDYVRNHWGIENKLHWVLDVHMNEDEDQKTERKSVRSFALMKRMALNILRSKDTTPKRSIRRKIKRAALDPSYLLSLLT